LRRSGSPNVTSVEQAPNTSISTVQLGPKQNHADVAFRLASPGDDGEALHMGNPDGDTDEGELVEFEDLDEVLFYFNESDSKVAAEVGANEGNSSPFWGMHTHKTA